METLYIPYLADQPALISVNGHKLLILSSNNAALAASSTLEADSTRMLDGGNSTTDLKVALHQLSDRIQAGIVIAPDDVSPDDLIKDLEEQLPWVQ